MVYLPEKNKLGLGKNNNIRNVNPQVGSGENKVYINVTPTLEGREDR